MPDRIDLLPERLQPNTVGQSLRQFRDMSELTQRDIAHRLQVSCDSVRHYEKGRTPLKTDEMVRYAAAMGLVVALFDRREYEALYGERDRLRKARLDTIDKAERSKGGIIIPPTNK